MSGLGCPSDVGLRAVPENERPVPGRSIDEPAYEPIGPGWNGGSQEWNDDAGWGPRRAGVAQVALAAAVQDWVRSVRSLKFWLVAAGIPTAASLAAWILLAAEILPQEDPSQAGGRYWAYVVAAALMPATSAFLAMHWGVQGVHRPAVRGVAPEAADPGPLATFFAVIGRGLVVAAAAVLLLLLHARLAEASGAMAGVAGGVVALEFAVFGAIGSGTAAFLRRGLLAGIAGWSMAAALVLGNVMAVWALWPAVRAEEPVAVAMNIERGPDGTLEAYECAPVRAGTAEIFHTERIMWLLAPNPVVMFVMLAHDSGTGPAATYLQAAADGTKLIPCVNAEPLIKGTGQMPLELLGLAMQGALAAAFLGGGQVAWQRRSRSAG